ncbi:hypothetical protein ACFX2I_035984 [Malus domestica]
MINEQEDDNTSRYFDLPLELIRSSVNEADSPISASFVFDTDRKGAQKNGSTRAQGRKSHESSRSVRFSTSSDAASPTACVTPRLRKARDDFKAFLEAQSWNGIGPITGLGLGLEVGLVGSILPFGSLGLLPFS